MILRVDADTAKQWPDKTVAQRWCQLFKGNLLVSRWLNKGAKPLNEAELCAVQDIIEEWRERLTNISWFIPLGHKCVI
ncbi:hypothetical protein [Spartinivicinus poritis]|uniref:Uncharacterized protein n=1 Tax=Spartinivicinus poritis TaxID=2994640 RepID=A0ABT5U748_9GAMM|nr:hypothetical protein [Spartinivicinus sp. A2-2]MDE1462185.1 hypothetical protein [Spartinivicinus sp. A2-2]